MNNPTKYLISFALLCLSNVAISEEIVFSINCKILDQVVLEVVDGESKRYTGFGDVKIGDKTSITFKFEERATAGSYRITYENDQSGQASVKQSIQNSSYNHIMENGRIIFKHMIRGSGEKTIALGQSYIRLAGNSGASITGRRYLIQLDTSSNAIATLATRTDAVLRSSATAQTNLRSDFFRFSGTSSSVRRITSSHSPSSEIEFIVLIAII